MKMTTPYLSRFLIFLGVIVSISVLAEESKIVIAHRGASGYLPEHTLEATAAAHVMGADYIEQDLVMTRDDQVIVLHDIILDAVTNVADMYPDRKRADGHFYAIDFDLDELKKLRVHERTNRETGLPYFRGRYPVGISTFRIPTFQEAIELIQGMNYSTHRLVGIYPELKAPEWHRRQGKDLAAVVMKILDDNGYNHRDAAAFVQCFEPETLLRLKLEFKIQLPLIQLIGENSPEMPEIDYNKMQTEEGLRKIASYAAGIGPSMGHIVSEINAEGQPEVTNLVKNAHGLGLLVHPYTFRADRLPPMAPDFASVLELFFFTIGVDGVFTDFPDQAINVLRNHPEYRKPGQAAQPVQPSQ